MHHTAPRGVREKTYSRGVSVFLECAIHSILDEHHRGVTFADFPLTKPSPFQTDADHAPGKGGCSVRKRQAARAKRARTMLLFEHGHSYTHTAKWVGLTERNLRKWAKRFHARGVGGLDEKSRSDRTPVFSPEVALYIVKLACERPDDRGRSLSQWDCPELARKLKADGIVQTISASNRWADLALS